MMKGSPITIREIDHVVLRSSNLQRLQRFYCDVLGCTVERSQPEIGLIQLRAGRSLIDLLERAPRQTQGVPRDADLDTGRNVGRNMDHFCLRLEPFDAEAIRAHLQRCGVIPGVVASRYGAEGEGPSIYIDDPDGNTVELKGPPMPDQIPDQTSGRVIANGPG